MAALLRGRGGAAGQPAGTVGTVAGRWIRRQSVSALSWRACAMDRRQPLSGAGRPRLPGAPGGIPAKERDGRRPGDAVGVFRRTEPSSTAHTGGCLGGFTGEAAAGAFFSPLTGEEARRGRIRAIPDRGSDGRVGPAMAGSLSAEDCDASKSAFPAGSAAVGPAGTGWR